ncbi:Outer membrane protein OmpA [Thauera chlorobenzoica]|uniref:OmpA domain protein n=2 Tax=Thauera chlorobenzoica TaxID=96773 RepID=A0A1H5XZN3_9RHOO|nr:OmpA domain protein [Thauera chlorobenzoica]SEG16820.1 Outer membrane protein OmpA [Thauera chlorobenzoica]
MHPPPGENCRIIPEPGLSLIRTANKVSTFPTANFLLMKHASFLPSLLAAALVAACATPGQPPDAAAGTDDLIHRHALVRPAAPSPDWPAVRKRVAQALANLPDVSVGSADSTGLSLRIPVADGFASGASAIRPPLARTLDALAPTLAGEAGITILVVGHTDSQGSEMVNLRLSIARAEAVVEHLRQRGIGLERLSADGRGESDPLTSNATEEGRARNRRVELFLRPLP